MADEPQDQDGARVTGRVFSGIQPTGSIHLGNYVGAIQNWVKLQDEHPCWFSIVDYHAITVPYEAEEMPGRVFDAALDILACGLDPDRCVFFVQSWAPEHTELCWLLNSLTSMGALERMTQFKEKSQQFRENINAGLFDYPVLQSADILLYRANLVPVGDDQLQHLELSRELARRFNHTFGELFPEPKPLLTQAKRVMALNDPLRKMSKSVPGSYISLTDSDAEMRKRIMRAVTDAGPETGLMSPGVENLFVLLEAFGASDAHRGFMEQYEAGTLRYGELKPAVADAVIGVLAPIRERRTDLAADRDQVWDALAAGSDRARQVAGETLEQARALMGIGRSRQYGSR